MGVTVTFWTFSRRVSTNSAEIGMASGDQNGVAMNGHEMTNGFGENGHSKHESSHHKERRKETEEERAIRKEKERKARENETEEERRARKEREKQVLTGTRRLKRRGP